MTHRAEILDRAKELTCGDRDQAYGDPLQNMWDIATGWSVILGEEVTPAQVAFCMTWIKICRAKTSPTNRDHFDDGAAYMAIAGECGGAK